MSVRVVRDNSSLLIKAIQRLSRQEVVVGVPDDGASRDDTPLSNSTIAYLMEGGVPEKNIPARPFLTPGMEEAKPQIIAAYKQAGIQALKDVAALRTTATGPGAVERGLHRIGLICQNSVRAKITDGPFVPLSPRTLRQRKRRGRTGEEPLLDTGQLRRSVTYVIRTKGK